VQRAGKRVGAVLAKTTGFLHFSSFPLDEIEAKHLFDVSLTTQTIVIGYIQKFLYWTIKDGRDKGQMDVSSLKCYMIYCMASYNPADPTAMELYKAANHLVDVLIVAIQAGVKVKRDVDLIIGLFLEIQEKDKVRVPKR